MTAGRVVSYCGAGGLQEVMAEEQRRRRSPPPSHLPLLPPSASSAIQGGAASGFTLGDYVAASDRPQPNVPSAWKVPGGEASSREVAPCPFVAVGGQYPPYFVLMWHSIIVLQSVYHDCSS